MLPKNLFNIFLIRIQLKQMRFCQRVFFESLKIWANRLPGITKNSSFLFCTVGSFRFSYLFGSLKFFILLSKMKQKQNCKKKKKNKIFMKNFLGEFFAIFFSQNFFPKFVIWEYENKKPKNMFSRSCKTNLRLSIIDFSSLEENFFLKYLFK